MTRSPYLDDILAQPAALRALAAAPAVDLGRLQASDRIVLTGMGSSLEAMYPAWLALTRAGRPAWHVECGELLHQARGLITRGTALCVASQSGRSAEVLALLERLPGPRPLIVALTNDASSPLAAQADVVLLQHAGVEQAVATRTYVTGLALADRLAAGVLGAPSTDLGPIADALDAYLAGHEAALATLRATFSPEDRLAIVGRGASLASARTGALVAQEAAKVPALGMSAAAFRHGPLELADARLALLVLAGDEPGRELNARLADDAQRLGARAFWVDDRPRVELGFVEAPGGTGLQRVIGEIAPLQLLSVALGDRQGLEPGRFRHLDKVTASE